MSLDPTDEAFVHERYSTKAFDQTYVPGPSKLPYRDRLKVGGVMRHDVAGRASIGREQCGLVRMFRS